MSFDVFAQRFIGGESADIDIAAVRAVLESYGVRGADEHGFVAVELEGGARVEVAVNTLFTGEPTNGCSFFLRSFGKREIDLCRSAEDVASALGIGFEAWSAYRDAVVGEG